MERNTDGITHQMVGRGTFGGVLRGGGPQSHSTPSPLMPVGQPMSGVKVEQDKGPDPTPAGDSDHGRPLSDTDRLNALSDATAVRRNELDITPLQTPTEKEGLPTMQGMVKTRTVRQCCLPSKEGHRRWLNQHGMGYYQHAPKVGPGVEPGSGAHGRTPGIRRALKALAGTRRANKERIAKGKLPVLEGETVSPKTFAAKTNTTIARVKQTIKRQRGK